MEFTDWQPINIYIKYTPTQLQRQLVALTDKVYCTPGLDAPITVFDARDAEKPPRFKVTPPEGAPNVVIVLIDDIGFGAVTSFGGRIHTPTFDRLADEGVRFNHFHTTALCSPTRAALLTGYYAQQVGRDALPDHHAA